MKVEPTLKTALGENIAFTVICLGLAFALICNAADLINIGGRRELFVDRHLIDTLDGARLVLHRPHREVPVVRFSGQPWEGHYSGYCTVLRDRNNWRLYYRGRPEFGKDGDPSEFAGLPLANGGAVHRMGFYHMIPANICGDFREEVVLWDPTASSIFICTAKPIQRIGIWTLPGNSASIQPTSDGLKEGRISQS
ncbi:MAG: hypothetical protein QM496_09975 [Verrucomicrobiota bacterium]